MENFGNKLYRLVTNARGELFQQGEVAQLTYGAFTTASQNLSTSQEEEHVLTYPIGLRPDNQPLSGTRTYTKGELLQRYQHLASHQLAVDGLIQLVTIVEALLSDIVRAVILRYPQKLGSKRTIPMQVVLEATSIEDVHLRAADIFLNELAYKSPDEFAESMKSLLSLNFRECPAFHRYLEVKATRDIYIQHTRPGQIGVSSPG
jgi:hypothetical protein